MKSFPFLFLASILFSFGASAQAHADRWTVLVYWAVDNDLYDFSIPYLKQFEKVGSTDQVHILVQTDYPGRKRPTERTLIMKDAGSPIHPGQDLPNSIILETLTREVNSAQPETLLDFMNWGKKRFPADHYALIIGSHGMNWRGIIADEHPNATMSLEGLKNTLNAFNQDRGQTLDLLILDACRMAFGDTLQALSGTAQLMLSSQFDLNGFDHQAPLSLLTQNPYLPAGMMAGAYLAAYPHTDSNQKNIAASLSSLDPEKVMLFNQDVKILSAAAISLSETELPLFQALIQSTRNEYNDRAIDLGNLVQAITQAAPRTLPALTSISKRYLPQVTLQNQDGTQIASGYSPSSILLGSTYTNGSSPANGVALNCASSPRRYAKSPFGKLHPEWTKVCDLIPNQEAETKNPSLTDAEEKLVLRLIDGICGDTWCEGDYNYRFKSLKCNFSQGHCKLTYDRGLWPAENQSIKWSQKNRKCALRGIHELKDLVRDQNGYQSLNETFYDQLNACFN